MKPDPTPEEIATTLFKLVADTASVQLDPATDGPVVMFKSPSFTKRAIASAIRAAEDAVRERCAEIALAIDSGRGNEKEIAAAIRREAGDAE